MSSSKAALKAVKAAIDGGDFTTAASKAEQVVSEDKQNYTAFLFLGFSHEKLNQDDDAEKAYRRAISLKDIEPQAYKGLITVFEKQGCKKLNDYHDITLSLGQIYAEKDDAPQCQNVIDRYELFAKKNGSRSQYIRALELILPTSPLYKCLEGRVMAPFHTYSRIIEALEAEEKEWINKEIGERRTRLGAKIENVTQEVKYEAYSRFQLEQIYHQTIDWTNDDEMRRTLEEKAFQRAYDTLTVSPISVKPAKRDQVLNLANGIVIIKHPFPLAWKVALEWVNAEDLGDWDVNVLREYIAFFPDDGLAKVLKGFLDSDISPFPNEPASASPENEKEEKEETETSPETKEADRLILMVQGIEDCKDSLLAHRILCDFYVSLDEFESAVDTGRRAQKICQQMSTAYGLDMRDTLDAVIVALATALISHQSPRYHPEARRLFEEVLKRKPTATSALLGVGIILEEDEDYGDAVGFLERALNRDPENIRVKSELAWCRAQAHDLDGGLQELRTTLEAIQSLKPVNLSMKSEVLYRIGWCLWERDVTKAARKSKEGPYRYFVDSIKANPDYAPAYTKLGIYFDQYSRNKQRSRSAFHKAFELSTSELEAAERLARDFAESGEWDFVELVAQRVVDSGKARPAPGSKKKAHSWPYAALGTVEVNKQQYARAIVSFQAALRISPGDYHSWVGLGESYHHLGRYIAATKTFQRAEALENKPPAEQTWFAKYMLANVCRERGLFEDAIDGYEAVLKMKPAEFGVSISLIQTLAESAWSHVEAGAFGQAMRKAAKVIEVALEIVPVAGHAFNLWKSVADACALFSVAQSYAEEINFENLALLLKENLPPQKFDLYASIDKIEVQGCVSLFEDAARDFERSDLCTMAAILAHKRAVLATADDDHAQAVAWYNLGWIEYQAHITASPKLRGDLRKQSSRFLKVAMRCFKRAIELEAGNSEFWNALGVATMAMNPKVSQHALVRSLHLNQRSARAWTNLGALYLIHEDKELANEAFTLAQSVDPDYAHAWLGQGLLAVLYKQKEEARGLFSHAFEIDRSSSISIKRQYALSVFDHLLVPTDGAPKSSIEDTDLLSPFFALQKLCSQMPHPSPSTIPYKHVLAELAERVGSFEDAISILTSLTAHLESVYETSESPLTLFQYACSTSDLARSQIASMIYTAAIDSATLSLDLTLSLQEDPETSSEITMAIRKIRLSSHLVLGLSHFFLLSESSDHIESSIGAFSTALSEADVTESPDIICALAQVLWAKGGEEEKSVARDRLFDTVERNPDHVGSVCLLGAIAVLDDDDDALEAVKGDLEGFRINERITDHDRTKVTRLLNAINELSLMANDAIPETLKRTANAASNVMLNPAHPSGWTELSQSSSDLDASQFAAAMAKQVALRAILTDAADRPTNAEDLATVLSGTGNRKDALLAIMVNPAGAEGWQTLGEALRG